jgi:TRAP-type mannitol/chloroaromatic compound transport system permease large subunit
MPVIMLCAFSEIPFYILLFLVLNKGKLADDSFKNMFGGLYTYLKFNRI